MDGKKFQSVVCWEFFAVLGRTFNSRSSGVPVKRNAILTYRLQPTDKPLLNKRIFFSSFWMQIHGDEVDSNATSGNDSMAADGNYTFFLGTLYLKETLFFFFFKRSAGMHANDS